MKENKAIYLGFHYNIIFEDIFFPKLNNLSLIISLKSDLMITNNNV